MEIQEKITTLQILLPEISDICSKVPSCEECKFYKDCVNDTN